MLLVRVCGTNLPPLDREYNHRLLWFTSRTTFQTVLIFPSREEYICLHWGPTLEASSPLTYYDAYEPALFRVG